MMRERWRIVIHRRRGMFRFLLRDGYLSKYEAQEAKRRIWRQHRIRYLKVEPYYLPAREGRMRQRSKHFNSRHAAVAAVACPVCHVAAGVPCVRARDGRPREAHGTETHVGRVNEFERDQTNGGKFDPQSGQGI